MLTSKAKLQRRCRRNRHKIMARRNTLPRLSIFRSNQHIYAQVIDDAKHNTIVAASTLDADVTKQKLKSTSNVEAAAQVGKLVAEKAKAKGIKEVVFDRGGNLYHGRLKALADAARENGLKF
jgi:large subunit ribosomal protein L18